MVQVVVINRGNEAEHLVVMLQDENLHERSVQRGSDRDSSASPGGRKRLFDVLLNDARNRWRVDC